MENEKTTRSTSDGKKLPKISPKRARMGKCKVRVDIVARAFTTNNCLFFSTDTKK